jgi:hypothetical protein
MRLWWKDLGHSFFYKRMASSSLKTLLDLQLSLLSLSVQAKKKNSLLLVWSLMDGGVKNKKEFFPFGKFFLLSS